MFRSILSKQSSPYKVRFTPETTSDAWIRAIRRNDTQRIEKLISLGDDVNFRIEKASPDYNELKIFDGDMPIHIAIVTDAKKNTLRCLIENNADINALTNSGLTTLHLAVEMDADRVVDFICRNHQHLMNNTGKVGATPLHLAVASNASDSFYLLVDAGADVSVPYQLGDDQCCSEDYFKDAKRGDTALHLAIRAGHFKFVKYLLLCDADLSAINEDRDDALRLAIKLGHEMIVSHLINYHTPYLAIRDIEKINFKYCGDDGKTPLMLAIERGHTYIALLLINSGIDVNKKFKKYEHIPYEANIVEDDTALHIAVRMNNIPVIRELIKASFKASCDLISSKNILKETPLSLADKKSAIYYELKLADYTLRINEHVNIPKITKYKKTGSYQYSSCAYDVGEPVHIKRNAANALFNVTFFNQDRETLQAHADALKRDELKFIYKGLR